MRSTSGFCFQFTTAENSYVQNDAINLEVTIEAADPDEESKSQLQCEDVLQSVTKKRLTISNVNNLMAVQSADFQMHQVPWRLTVSKSSSYLDVYLFVSSEDAICDLTMKVKLIPRDEKGKMVEQVQTMHLIWFCAYEHGKFHKMGRTDEAGEWKRTRPRQFHRHWSGDEQSDKCHTLQQSPIALSTWTPASGMCDMFGKSAKGATLCHFMRPFILQKMHHNCCPAQKYVPNLPNGRQRQWFEKYLFVNVSSVSFQIFHFLTDSYFSENASTT